ncbi:MAG: type II toxin-antitoxin system Phd/YefM family antitoxin [Acidobacteria bacterium]|nr:type II toxin-antitoxin system Phd/YefM family antitoxin [Acidobacteriota bacterium]
MAGKVQVGIKELKDKASAVIDSVVRSGRPVTITKNRREVARIVPSDQDLYARLSECGLIAQRRKSDWKSLKLERIGKTSAPAIESISSDRDER